MYDVLTIRERDHEFIATNEHGQVVFVGSQEWVREKAVQAAGVVRDPTDAVLMGHGLFCQLGVRTWIHGVPTVEWFTGSETALLNRFERMAGRAYV